MVAIDMEMPKNCIFCPLYVGKKGEGVCAITKKWNAIGGITIADDCPLVEIEERKVGKWIKATKPSGLVGFECSNCGAFYPFIDKLNYCPNCGAEMVGGEE